MLVAVVLMVMGGSVVAMEEALRAAGLQDRAHELIGDKVFVYHYGQVLEHKLTDDNKLDAGTLVTDLRPVSRWERISPLNWNLHARAVLNKREAAKRVMEKGKATIRPEDAIAFAWHGVYMPDLRNRHVITDDVKRGVIGQISKNGYLDIEDLMRNLGYVRTRIALHSDGYEIWFVDGSKYTQGSEGGLRFSADELKALCNKAGKPQVTFAWYGDPAHPDKQVDVTGMINALILFYKKHLHGALDIEGRFFNREFTDPAPGIIKTLSITFVGGKTVTATEETGIHLTADQIAAYADFTPVYPDPLVDPICRTCSQQPSAHAKYFINLFPHNGPITVTLYKGDKPCESVIIPARERRTVEYDGTLSKIVAESTEGGKAEAGPTEANTWYRIIVGVSPKTADGRKAQTYIEEDAIMQTNAAPNEPFVGIRKEFE